MWSVAGSGRAVGLRMGMVLLAACAGATGTSTPAPPPPPEVAVVTVAPKRLPLTRELPGRVEASRTAEVRARVPGIVLERAFREGAEVKEGELLYRIDPAPFRAALARAEASLAVAKAQAQQARAREGRVAQLAPSNAVSRQEADDAVATLASAEAQEAAALAAVTQARLDLSYASVTAPIGGRIGRSVVTEGALVGQGSATLMATIQQLDPVYVNVARSVAELAALRKAVAAGQVEGAGDSVPVEIVLSDGSVHTQAGVLLFTDVSVEPTTGTVQLRVEVPNPDGALLPGAYVRARLAQAVAAEAITVPQQAVVRSVRGASVMVVDEAGVVTPRPVEVGDAVGAEWRVNAGLTGGERVIVEGLQRARPGATVTVKAWE